jgi:hypothetical protein
MAAVVEGWSHLSWTRCRARRGKSPVPRPGILTATAEERWVSHQNTQQFGGAQRSPFAAPLRAAKANPEVAGLSGASARPYGRRATRSISTSAPTASAVTPTVVRAGS